MRLTLKARAALKKEKVGVGGSRTKTQSMEQFIQSLLCHLCNKERHDGLLCLYFDEFSQPLEYLGFYTVCIISSWSCVSLSRGWIIFFRICGGNIPEIEVNFFL